MSIAPHLLLVDDDSRLRSLLMRLLVKEGYIINTAADVKTADDMLQLFRFDAVILDYMLPETNGVEALTRWRKAGLSMPVLMLTALGETDHRIIGLEAGADDYLAKPFEPKELLLRLKSLLRRGGLAASAPSRAIRFGSWLYALGSGTLTNEAGESLSLTTAETTLLDTLAGQLNSPVSREALINEYRDSSRAVDVAVSRLRRKLGGSEWLQSVRGVGYRLLGQRGE